MSEKTEMHHRINDVRSAAGLTLEKFGERLGVKKSTVGNIENGRTVITERMIKSICREFNVSEEWLRTGEGEMYVPQTRNQEIAAFMNQVMADEDETFRKRLITALAELNLDEWKTIEKGFDKMLLKKD